MAYQTKDLIDAMIEDLGESLLIRNQGNLYSTYYDQVQFDEYGHEIEGEGLDRPLFAAIETQADIGFLSCIECRVVYILVKLWNGLKTEWEALSLYIEARWYHI